jgi:hypothetical protein
VVSADTLTYDEEVQHGTTITCSSRPMPA